MWINYPNNPTAALAAPGFYERVVAFAQKYDVIVASDLAYSEMYYEAPPRRSWRRRARARSASSSTRCRRPTT
jgi:LL-diaminopimelate aminotransferase